MVIHIGRSGTKLGSFSDFDVRQGLRSGEFLPGDLGWMPGMDTWTPLSDFPELEFTPPPLPPLPDSPDAQKAAGAGSEPVGAQCGLPWDFRREMGFMRGFLETARMVLFTPRIAFQLMTEFRPISGPIFYNLVGAWSGWVVLALYAVLFTLLPGTPSGPASEAQPFVITHAKAVMELEFWTFMGPVLVTLIALALAIAAHLLLMLTGGANRSFQVTLRVLCFIYGSVQLLLFIPFVGSFMAIFWMIYCSISGLAAAHQTSAWRPAIAVGLFFAGCVAVVVVILSAALAASPQAMQHMMTQ